MSRESHIVCLKCGGKLIAMVRAVIPAPLAAKGGTVKVGGVKFTQINIKEAWDNDIPNGGAPRQLRGPIKCGDCETEHFYVIGSKKPLRLGDYLDAMEVGYDTLTQGE